MYLSLLTCLKAKIIGRKALMPKIAKKNMIVYKGLLFNMKSPFMKSPVWIKGIEYHTSMQDYVFKNPALVVTSGYFSFKKLRQCKNYFGDFEFRGGVRIFKGIVKKGSRYYKGQNGEIASENLRLVEEVFCI